MGVMVYCWAQGVSYPDSGDGIIFALVNSFIHSIMYPYYALTVKCPCVRWQPLRIGISLLQISCMFFGIYLRWYSESYCTPLYPERNRWVGYFGWLIYVSYAILFVKFFVDEYVLKK